MNHNIIWWLRRKWSVKVLPQIEIRKQSLKWEWEWEWEWTPPQPIPSTQAISVSSAAYIYELREDILHPLVDSTNSRLAKVCSGGEKGGIPPWAVQSCEKVRAKKFFSPSQYTVAVHMWTHTFLGWSFFRGWYNSRVYAQVERELVPTNSCPNVFTEDWYQN